MLDSAIIMAITTLMVMMALSAGFRRGVELMPWPDGLEYAASAVNLASGRGAVLHFGGYTYPSRYTAGYPLILELFYRSFDQRADRLFFVSLVLGMTAVFSIFNVARDVFGRAAAAIAALLLALSPVFITYSMLVMSDVPTLFVTLFALLMLRHAASDDSPASPNRLRISLWLMFGLLAGFSTIIRPTNVTIFAGLALCVVMVPLQHRDRSSLLKAAIA
ncbi:MAG TPA: glycosyltransferase family 39 protein, partial [Methylomirabilota bacterium]|nr:glycosyltransferase family 39 protein [Methylomirabilota bacterium]